MRTKLLFLALMGFLISAHAEDFDRAAFMHMAMSTVRIEAMAPDGHINVGTGVIVDKERVVTSCHVTGPAPRISVLYGGLRYKVRQQRADSHHDLCFLIVPDLDDALVSALGSARTLKLGDTVVAMGFTGGFELQFADGTVRGLYDEQGFPIIKSSTAFSSGASGGGLYNRNGQLVGILTFRLRGAEDCYYSMPVDWILSWIKSSEGFEEAHLLEGLPVWKEPPERQPHFLQAMVREAAKDYPGLEALAKAWIHEAPESADAWFELGKAELRMRMMPEAIEALNTAVKFEPRLAEAWFSLAEAYRDQKRDSEFRRAEQTLGQLDSQLAERLVANPSP